MKMNKYVLLVMLIAPALGTAAQGTKSKSDYVANQSHIGITAGALAYSGRYSVKSSLGSFTSYAVSAFYDHKIILPSQLFVRGEVLFGQLKGDNTEEQDATGTRGFFKGNILEGTVKAQYDILNTAVTNWSPYVIAGVGAYRLFNYSSTNGSKDAGDKLGFIMPVGGGVKYKAGNRMNVFLEGNLRFFPKNLDNRESDNNPNKYYSLALGVSYRLQKVNELW